MNNIIKKETYIGYTICVVSDDTPQNPRIEFDNIGTIVCWHKREKYGDEQPKISITEYLCEIAGIECDYVVNTETLITNAEKKAIILPVYMYDHSGVCLQTTPFNDHFDNGLLGVIYVRRDSREIEGMTDEQIKNCLEKEVETYSDYLSGNVYGYEIYFNADGNHLDSCWGYYGSDFENSSLLPTAREMVDTAIKRQLADHFKALKGWIRNKVPLMYRNPAL